MTAEAIAGYLNKKVYNVNYAELESKYVGETPKNIRKVFEKAQKDDAVLIFDEADSFLGKRLKNVTQSSDYGVNITRSVMLMELEKYSGIVIFTTNLISNYDDAFKRRILANIKFDLPDECGRKKIWDIYINRGIPIESNINSTMLSQKYVNISAKRVNCHFAMEVVWGGDMYRVGLLCIEHYFIVGINGSILGKSLFHSLRLFGLNVA